MWALFVPHACVYSSMCTQCTHIPPYQQQHHRCQLVNSMYVNTCLSFLLKKQSINLFYAYGVLPPKVTAKMHDILPHFNRSSQSLIDLSFNKVTVCQLFVSIVLPVLLK